MIPPVDVLILGGGPAGLSVATSTVRQAHSTIILDSGKYRNEASRHMHTVPTWDHRDPKEFLEAAAKDFDRYGTVKIEKVDVESVKQTEQGLFEATGNNNQVYVGRKLVLATGVEDIYPDIPGYAECWVTGIFHCLYCHGWEEMGTASSGVLAVGDVSAVAPVLHFARQGLRLSKEVTIYTHGNDGLANEIHAALEKAPAPMKVDPRRITKLSKAPQGAEIDLRFEDDTKTTEGFLAHKPKFQLRGPFAQQLGLELTPQGIIKVNPPFNQTSVKGVFACGDIASPMHTVTQALFSGTACGAGAPAQLQAEQWNQKALI